MELLELFNKVEKESDNYFIIEKTEIDINLLIEVKDLHNFNNIKFTTTNGYIIIFNINKEIELNGCLELTINKIIQTKKDSF